MAMAQRDDTASAVGLALHLAAKPDAVRRLARRRTPLRAYGIEVGLGIAALFLLGAVVSYVLDRRLLAVCCVGGAVGVAAGWCWTRIAMRALVDQPLNRIARELETLAARDIAGIADALANLAQGEEAQRLDVFASCVEVPSLPAIGRIAEALNMAIQRVEGSAAQFNSSAEEPCRRLFYVGPDDYLLGAAAAEAMAALAPDGGELLVMTGLFKHTGMELRRRGFDALLRERFPSLQITGVIENRYDPVRSRRLVAAFVRSHPGLVGIYSAEGVGVQGAIAGLADSGLGGRVAVICHDLLGETAAAIEAGEIHGSIVQDPFSQGYDLAVHLFNHVVHGWRPAEPRLITASTLVTRENLAQYWDTTASAMRSPEMADRDARPLGPSPRPIRIAILGVNDNQFWSGVRDGVLAAAATLHDANATVDWILPETDNAFDVSSRGRMIQDLVREGVDAIATPLFDLALVPYLNAAAECGIAVATYNAEATRLQELITVLSRQRRSLELTATRLEAEAHHDSLTGVGNRLLMDRDLAELKREVVATGRRASVVMMDLDRFKGYNDAYGHAGGDDVLRKVAHRIDAEIRPQDRIYRFGGEEFLVVLRDTDLEEGQRVAERLIGAIAALGLPHSANAPWGTVTASAGLAVVTADLRPVEAAVADADVALYVAKNAGRNRVCASPVDLPSPGAHAA